MKPKKKSILKRMLFSGKWAYEDSNLGPHPYQGCALAS